MTTLSRSGKTLAAQQRLNVSQFGNFPWGIESELNNSITTKSADPENGGCQLFHQVASVNCFRCFFVGSPGVSFRVSGMV